MSNEQLRGKTAADQAQILQWIEYGEQEINPASATLVYPCMGIMQFNKQNNERAKEELTHILQLLNNYLRTKTYLVGERITLADIAVACDMLLLFQWVRTSKWHIGGSDLVAPRLSSRANVNRSPTSAVGSRR